MAAEANAQLGTWLGRSRVAAFLRLQGHRVRRLGWGVADQAASSVSNAAVSIYVARTLGAVQFGAFSLAYVTYSFALGASRGLATDPLVVRFSGTDEKSWRRAVASATGTAATAGLVMGACVLLVAGLLSGTARAAFVALGVTLPALMLQDSWRYSFFAHGRGSQAFLNDTIWSLTLIPALVYLRFTNHADVFWFVLAWGATAGIAAAAGPLQARVIPRMTRVRVWLSQHHDLGFRYFAENTASSGANQLRTYGVGLILGLAAVGYVQAALTLMGPFMVIFFGLSLVTVPEAARVLRGSPRHLPLFCLLVAGGLALLAVIWGGVLLVILPKGFGYWLLHGVWRPTYPLVLPLTISVAGGCVIAGATAGLHALGAAQRSLRAMLLASAIFVVCGLVGAATGGSLGVVIGAAVATWVGALLWWRELRVALRNHGMPEGPRLGPGRHRRPPGPQQHRQPAQ